MVRVAGKWENRDGYGENLFTGKDIDDRNAIPLRGVAISNLSDQMKATFIPDYARERDSNYSSGLTVWDRLHGTAGVVLGRDDVEIGLPDHGRAEDVTLVKTLALPFNRRDSTGD